MDVATQRAVAHFPTESAVTRLLFSLDGNWLAGGSVDDRVVVWNIPGREQAFVASRAPRSGAIAFSSDSGMLATGGSDGQLMLWSLSDRRQTLQIAAHQNVVVALGFSPNGTVLASGGLDGASKLWDARTGQPLRRLVGQLLPAQSFGFSEDARRLVAGFNDGTVKVWDLATARELLAFPGPDRMIREAVFLDENTLVNLELFSLVVRRAATKAEADLVPRE
jgi:WD40 repeat protein